MKIKKIKPLKIKAGPRGDWVLVSIETDEGITGIGEASHSHDDALMMATLNGMNEALSGQDPLNIESIVKLLRRERMSWIRQTALSAVEQALWDIMGKYLNAPIYLLFGGAVRKSIRLYANLNRYTLDRTPEGFGDAAGKAVAEGFTAVKIAPFDELKDPDHVRTGSRAAWRTGVERIRAVRSAVGQSIEIAVDCHGRMEASEAVMVAEAVMDCSLLWLEDPVAGRFPDQLRSVSDRIPMATATGENLFGMDSFRPFLTERVVDIIIAGCEKCRRSSGNQAYRRRCSAPKPAGLAAQPRRTGCNCCNSPGHRDPHQFPDP